MTKFVVYEKVAEYAYANYFDKATTSNGMNTAINLGSGLIAGFAANGAMPAWKQLSDTEIAAVITYTKNSWSNQTGKLVQPAEILAARK